MIRLDSSQFYAGKIMLSQYAGFGIQAQDIPSTGESGPAAIYNDIAEQGAAPTDEMMWEILTVPASGVFTPYESSEFTLIGADDGVHFATYRGRRNGVIYGDYTVMMTIGDTELQLDASGGTFSYSGGVATLTYTPVATAYELNADGGVFSYSGGAANLIYGNTLQADGGALTYAGGSAAFSRTYLLQAAGGAFLYSGGVATLNYSAAVYSRINGYTISYAPSSVSAQYSDN